MQIVSFYDCDYCLRSLFIVRDNSNVICTWEKNKVKNYKNRILPYNFDKCTLYRQKEKKQTSRYLPTKLLPKL